MTIEQTILSAVTATVEKLYGPLEGLELQLQKTRKEFSGDYTLVVFPLLSHPMLLLPRLARRL
mgnify:CR=1 FL=1